jgi:hypothetical protein
VLLLLVLIPGLVVALPAPGAPWWHRTSGLAHPGAASEAAGEDPSAAGGEAILEPVNDPGEEATTWQGEQAASPQQAASSEPAPLPGEAPPLRLDPLLALLSEQDPDGVIAAARPQPAQSLLELELGEGFIALAGPRRHQLAESWLERARSLGYTSLELVDQGGRLLGRSALVGEGMIMFEPSTVG